jgi:predicted TPR repeat methyltransferase
MSDSLSPDTELLVELPATADGNDQDAEWCMVTTPEGRRRLRFHDYAEIFQIEGLYERLFYEELRCTSPTTVRTLLEDVLTEADADPSELIVLDVGAGNGMVGEQLDELGAAAIVGVDILQEAADATERDRPGVYDDYHVVDLTDPAPEEHAALSEAGFNCMTSVAALGFGDMPPAAFAQAFDYIDGGGLVAFTIKERFTKPKADETGFAALLRSLQEGGALDVLVEHRYEHRLSAAGDPLHYMAYVARKQADASDLPS